MALTAGDKIPIPSPPAGTAEDGTLLPLPYVSQNPYSELCWAACCAMIVGMFQRAQIALCQMVNIMFNADSCRERDLSRYNKPEWPDNIFHYYRYSCLYLKNVLTLGSIVYEINNGRPINVVLQWGVSGADEGKHLVIVSGYYSNGEVHVVNPLSPSEENRPGEATSGRIAYDHLKSAFGLSYWYGSYYNLAPANAASR